MIYILYFLTLAMVVIFLTNRKQALLISVTLTFLFLSLSYPSGGDWIGYFLNYNCIINSNCEQGFILFEPGYEFIVSIVGNLGFQTIIVFIALVNSIFLYHFAKNFENGAFVLFALMCMFLWSIYVEAIRQALAFSIITYGFISLYREQKKRFLIIVAIASLFHVTALIAVVFLIPLYSLRLGKLAGYALLATGVVFFFFANDILYWTYALLPGGSIAGEKLHFYLESEQYKPQLSIGFGSILDILLIYIVIYSFIRIKKFRLYSSEKANAIVFLGVCLYICFGILIGKMMPVMTRLGWYGFPLVIVLLYSNLGNSIFYSKNNQRNVFSQLIIYAYVSFQILRPFTYDYSNYNIFHQELIFQNIDSLDDRSLMESAKNKCHQLSKMGYGYLCDI